MFQAGLLRKLVALQEVAKRMPGALLVVLVGVIIAIIQYPSVLRTLRFGPSIPHLVWPSWEEWKKGAALSNLSCIVTSVLL